MTTENPNERRDDVGGSPGGFVALAQQLKALGGAMNLALGEMQGGMVKMDEITTRYGKTVADVVASKVIDGVRPIQESSLALLSHAADIVNTVETAAGNLKKIENLLDSAPKTSPKSE